MYTDIMVGIVAGATVIIALLLLLIVYLGVNIANKLEDLLQYLRGGLGLTSNETRDGEKENE